MIPPKIKTLLIFGKTSGEIEIKTLPYLATSTVMPIYITRWFIISLVGKNNIPGFPLCLKKCEDETKTTKTYIKNRFPLLI